MRIFPAEEERRLYRLERARGWSRSGLIAPEQLAPIEAEAGDPLACAGYAVRLLFFGFTALAQAAVVFFYSEFFKVRESEGLGLFMMFLAVPWYALGEYSIRKFRHHRFGIEEALLTGAAVNLCVGLILTLTAAKVFSSREISLSVSLIAAAAAFWLYLRAGYLYAGLAFIAALSSAVVAMDLRETALRMSLAGLYAGLLALSSLRAEVPDFERDGWEGLRASLFLGIYLVLNVKLESLGELTLGAGRAGEGFFYWTTFALVWIIPPLCFAVGLRSRGRALLIASTITGLVTVTTLKPYLGLERHVWDAALLGTFLMGAAVFLKRWLDAGPGGSRSGFTAKPLLVLRETGLNASALLAGGLAAQAGPAAGAPTEKGFEGGGGKFGGGGASGDF